MVHERIGSCHDILALPLPEQVTSKYLKYVWYYPPTECHDAQVSSVPVRFAYPALLSAPSALILRTTFRLIQDSIPCLSCSTSRVPPGGQSTLPSCIQRQDRALPPSFAIHDVLQGRWLTGTAQAHQHIPLVCSVDRDRHGKHGVGSDSSKVDWVHG